MNTTLRQDCEGILLALPSKSKLLLVLASWKILRNESICRIIATYQMPGAMLIFSSKGTIFERTAAIGVTV